jgi:hypothetical protein
MLWVRPQVKDLEFRLYGRPVHPELHDVIASRTIRRKEYTLTVRLTPFGHVLEWSNAKTHLVELTTCTQEPLPEGGLITRKFGGERRGRCSVNGVRYQVSLHAETLSAEIFLHVHKELCADGANRGMLYHFAPHNRLALTPLGFVTVEPLPSGLSVATFHTFPSELTIVKTQSLIEP